MQHVLDNPVWNALNTHNRHLGEGNDDVKYFDPQVSPFAAMREDTEENLQELYRLHPGRRGVFLWTSKLLPPVAPWTELHCIPGWQMVYDGTTPPEVDRKGIVPLTATHVPAMLALTAQTRPGPFDQRTIAFGNYEGIFEGAELAAMTGQRFRCEGHTEISAVCTGDAFLGRGYANRLVLSQVQRIVSGGDTPYLHVRADNDRAIGVYERIGFGKRMPVYFYVLKK